MRKTIVLALLLLATAFSLHAEVKKPGVATSVIHFSKNDPGPQGILAMTESTAKGRPALILVQEWWGLNDWIKQNAERYASMGYVVVAPDLYRGKIAADADEAHQLMRGMPEDRAMADLQGAFEYLASRPDVDPKRIGVVGWCMGGGYALALGIAEPRLAAVVINYGRLVTDPATIAKIKPAVQGNFGATDKGIPVDDVKAFEKALKTTNGSVDFMIFDGAGHGFMNPNNKTGYAAAAADTAWKRMDAFLAKNLGKL
ncbi:MAG: dienelactone hydrolase family protein [Thermoanaerobaculia bacterium]|jgi:carboxymethylenebutenolidase